MLKDKIREIIEKKGIPQEEAADLLGISQGALNHYLTGRRQIKTSFIELFCLKFNISLSDLYDNTNQPKEKYKQEILSDIFVTVERWLQTNQYELEPEDKVNLVFALYDRVENIPQEQRAAEIISLSDFLYKNRKTA